MLYLPEYWLAFKSLSTQRNGGFKRFVVKQQESPHDPIVFWELPTDVHADWRKEETQTQQMQLILTDAWFGDHETRDAERKLLLVIQK